MEGVWTLSDSVNRCPAYGRPRPYHFRNGAKCLSNILASDLVRILVQFTQSNHSPFTIHHYTAHSTDLSIKQPQPSTSMY